MTPPGGGTTLDRTSAALPETPERESRPPLPALTVLSHPDLSRIGDRVFLGELARGRELLLSRQEPRFAAPRAGSGEPLADPFLSRRPIRFAALPDGGVVLRRDGSPIQVVADGVPIEDERSFTAASLAEGVVLELAERIVLLLHRRPPPEPASPPPGALLGESAEIEEVRRAVSRAAPLAVPVAIRGETGTGKELAAQALHEQSPRAAGPFLAVNLGALPPSLAAAELFGARKGAYTGAVQDLPGWFGRADGGTLFLDEIGEAPPEVQVMLLRALETGEIVAVGSQAPRRVDVRVVSATDADLEAAVQRGAFRAPLLHRLAGLTIRLPPLRRRREDLGRLLIHFLALELAALGGEIPPSHAGGEPWLPAALMARLARSAWPGNVRQLRNAARQLAVDGHGRAALRMGSWLDDLLPAEAVPAEPAAAAEPAPPPTAPSARLRKPAEISEEELRDALRANRWNLKAAAAALGIARTSLYILLDQSPHVRAAADVPPEEVRAAFARCGGDVAETAAALEVSERALRQRLKDLGLSREKFLAVLAKVPDVPPEPGDEL
jgi:two-component system, NtrC family, nitrogen regulation response regulator GlnG